MGGKRVRVRDKVLVVAITVLIAVVVFILACSVGQKETYTSGDGKRTEIEALVCQATNPEGGFLESETAEKVTHEIRITFRGDEADKWHYVFLGEYASPEAAIRDENALHSYYDIHMGKEEIPLTTFSPAYLLDDEELKITFYTNDKNDLTTSTASLFFIDATESATIMRAKIGDLKTLYEKKGFSCTIK